MKFDKERSLGVLKVGVGRMTIVVKEIKAIKEKLQTLQLGQ